MKGARLLDESQRGGGAGEPLDATGGSQDGVAAFAVGQVVPDDDPEIVIHYRSGGRARWWEGILVLKRRGKELVAILEATLGRDEWKGSANLSLSKDGAIHYRAPGKPEQTLRWDPVGFAYR